MRQSGQNKQSKRNKEKLLKKYILIVFAMVGTFVLLSSIGVYAFLKPDKEADLEDLHTDYSVDEIDTTEIDKKTKEKDGFLQSLLLPPEKTNAIILCTDNVATLADVIIIVSFDRNTAEIQMLNIPRDLYTDVLEDIRSNVLEEANRKIPSVCKINELHSYAGKEWGPWAVRTQLEDTLGIKIDYTVRIDLDAFKQIVDLIGPIEMEIPKGGLHYEDPLQDLYIHVPEGLQQLTGETAEQVVRFRGTYAQGDVQRVGVQQEFIKLAFEQAIQKDKLLNNIPGLVSTLIEYVETDYKIDTLPKYLPYVSKLSGDKLITNTLPGEARDVYYGEKKRVSYYFYDPDETKALVEEIFYSTSDNNDELEVTDSENATATTDAPSKSDDKAETTGSGLKIQVLSAGDSKTAVNDTISLLVNAGHKAADGGKYSGSPKDYTRIMVKDDNTGKIIKALLKDGVVEVDKELPDDVDAFIIVKGAVVKQ